MDDESKKIANQPCPCTDDEACDDHHRLETEDDMRRTWAWIES